MILLFSQVMAILYGRITVKLLEVDRIKSSFKSVHQEMAFSLELQREEVQKKLECKKSTFYLI